MSEDLFNEALLGMPGPQGTLMRLARAWPASNLGVWMVAEKALNTPMPQTAEALAIYVAAVIDAFAGQTTDRKAAMFSPGIGILPRVEAELKARIAKEAAAKKNGLLLPGLGG